MFEERSEIYIAKAISLPKVALRLIERISNVKTERNNEDIFTFLTKIKGKTDKMNIQLQFSQNKHKN